MNLTGLHLLLTYQCNLECDHCFVWGSPWQSGTMTSSQVWQILRQAKELGSIEWIYFEGGEPFLYYPVLLKGVRQAARSGFKVGIVSNVYWATSRRDAREWLRPFAGLVEDLSISSDLYHWNERLSRQAQLAREAAESLRIPVGIISIAPPYANDPQPASGQLPLGESAVMYRGRAAQVLVERATHRPWYEMTGCPYEDLRDPGRVHVDPFGNLHLCQGIVLGNLFETPLVEIVNGYAAEDHPIAGPLLAGGPKELAARYGVPHGETYADACHLCDETRRLLRARFPEILTPDQMYFVPQ